MEYEYPKAKGALKKDEQAAQEEAHKERVSGWLNGGLNGWALSTGSERRLEPAANEQTAKKEAIFFATCSSSALASSLTMGETFAHRKRTHFNKV